MSFSTDIKKELTGLRIKRRDDAAALLSAFTLSIGSLKRIAAPHRWGVHFVSENNDCIALAARLAAQYYDLECSITQVSHERLNAVYHELLLYGEHIERFMLDTGLMNMDQDGNMMFSLEIPAGIDDTETKRRAFIRGLFLACGSVTKPQKAYHAEFVFKNAELAAFAANLLHTFGLNPKRTKRRAYDVVYIKNGEQLADLLALMGASSAMITVTETRIFKQAANEANRSVNCINANLERVSQAALRQLEDIRLVMDTLGGDGLSEPLRVAAEVRLNNLDMSLAELAEELGIGRSAVNYRLKKISEMAEDIRTGALS